jgi:hypothetical protein
MCAVSVIYDVFAKMPDTWYDQERLGLFRRMVSDAKVFDILAGTPDCEDPEKAKLLFRIEELENKYETNKND